MTSFKFLEIALKTASDGYPVFPLIPGKKTPIYEGGFHIATRDVEQIRKWWTRTPYANIGIPTGAASGMAALDVDPDKGGFDSCKALFSAHGGQPHTPIVRTPRGGWHIYFKHPEGLRNSASKIGAGLDIRGEGGYVVRVGSLADGVEYTWVVTPDDAPIAPFPEWLLELAIKPDPPKSLATADGFVPEGSRNDYLTRLAGSMRRAGFDGEAIEKALLTQNQRACDPPLPEQEVHQVVGSAEGWEQGVALENLEAPLEAAYRRMGFVAPDQWLNEPEEPERWLVDGLVPAGTLTMVTSFPKAGKSTFTRHLALAVAKGEEFLGCKVEQGKVLYLAIEEPKRAVQKGFRRLGLCEGDPLQLKFSRPDANAVDDLKAIVGDQKPSLVVIDTVTRMPKAHFEMNDYMRNSEWLDPYMYLAHDQDVTILVNYHSSRNGRALEGIDSIAAPLGSVGIIATPDQIIAIRVESDGSRSLSSVGRYDPLPPTLMAFDRGTERLSAVGEKSAINHQRLREAIVEALDSDEWRLQKGTLEAVKGDATDKLKALAELLDEHVIERQGQGKKSSPYELRMAIPFPVSTLVGKTQTENDPGEELIEFLEDGEEGWTL